MLLGLMMGSQRFVSAWNRLIFLRKTAGPPRLSLSRITSNCLYNQFDLPRQEPNVLLRNVKLLRLLIQWITRKVRFSIELYIMRKKFSWHRPLLSARSSLEGLSLWRQNTSPVFFTKNKYLVTSLTLIFLILLSIWATFHTSSKSVILLLRIQILSKLSSSDWRHFVCCLCHHWSMHCFVFRQSIISSPTVQLN
jgi:hypothetical protein